VWEELTADFTCILSDRFSYSYLLIKSDNGQTDSLALVSALIERTKSVLEPDRPEASGPFAFGLYANLRTLAKSSITGRWVYVKLIDFIE
jgi:hypothetical protein